MKRIAAISLLGLLFFNWYGYRILTAVLEEQSNNRLEARLDQHDYEETQLLEFRIPIQIPYQTDWTAFERYDADVEIAGVHYKAVKRKLLNGEMIVLCLPNKEKQFLQNARNDFFKLVNDLQHQGQDKSDSGHSKPAHKGISDYQQEKNDWSIQQVAFCNTCTMAISTPVNTADFSRLPAQPPDSNSKA